MKQRIPHHYKSDEWVSPNSLKWIRYRLECNWLSFRREMKDFYRWINNSWTRSFLFVWTATFLIIWTICWFVK